MKHKVHCHYGVASSQHHGGLGPTDRRAAAEPHSAHTDAFSTCSKAGEDLAKYKGHCFPHFQPALEIKRETVLADRFVPRGKKKVSIPSGGVSFELFFPPAFLGALGCAPHEGSRPAPPVLPLCASRPPKSIPGHPLCSRATMLSRTQNRFDIIQSKY